jgi:hypothetical protein
LDELKKQKDYREDVPFRKIYIHEIFYKKSRDGTLNPYVKCKYCGREFFGNGHKGHLRRHEQAVHEKLKPFKCDLCEYSAIEKNQLKNHLTAHGKIEKCNLCEASFKGNGRFQQLFKHQKSHKKASFSCTIAGCSKLHKSELGLKLHLKAVHKGKIYYFLLWKQA